MRWGVTSAWSGCKPNARLNSAEARKRADSLQGRLAKRLEELKLERQIAPLPPVVLVGLLVVPAGLLAKLTGKTPPTPPTSVDTQAIAARARAIVMAIERDLGFEPTDREHEKLGYDIESHYLRRPFQREPDFGVTSVNCDLADLIARAERPC